ncbi:hypothetical protein, partial [Mesorhizobium sp.]|uniref:hypothetical protein n=1 Tax=Mesorhizobium sp. TaxID=1871066 RepID=UPI0025CCECE1
STNRANPEGRRRYRAFSILHRARMQIRVIRCAGCGMDAQTLYIAPPQSCIKNGQEAQIAIEPLSDAAASANDARPRRFASNRKLDNA